MTGTIIDRSNWKQMRVGPGDMYLNALGQPIAVVRAVSFNGPKRGVVTVFTKIGTGEIEYELDAGRTSYEWLIEFRGYRFMRPAPTTK